MYDVEEKDGHGNIVLMTRLTQIQIANKRKNKKLQKKNQVTISGNEVLKINDEATLIGQDVFLTNKNYANTPPLSWQVITFSTQLLPSTLYWKHSL